MKSIKESLETNVELSSELEEYAGQIEILEESQSKYKGLLKQFYEESHKLELKFQKDSEEIFNTRANIISQIPNFWRSVILNHPEAASLVRKHDMNALSFLKNVFVDLLHQNDGFRLVFEFQENEYFSNKSLEKTYYLGRSENNFEVFYDNFVGTEIDWKPNNDLTTKLVSKTQRHKSTGQVRVINLREKQPSFFDFFNSSPVPKDIETMAEEELEELEADIQFDFSIAEVFKTKLIPFSIDWFTGKALEYEEIDYASEQEESESDIDSD